MKAIERSAYCTNCKHRFSVMVPLHKNATEPKEDDYTLCTRCLVVGKFDDALNILPLTPDQLVALFMEKQPVYEALMKMKEYIIKRKQL